MDLFGTESYGMPALVETHEAVERTGVPHGRTSFLHDVIRVTYNNMENMKHHFSLEREKRERDKHRKIKENMYNAIRNNKFCILP